MPPANRHSSSLLGLLPGPEACSTLRSWNSPIRPYKSQPCNKGGQVHWGTKTGGHTSHAKETQRPGLFVLHGAEAPAPLLVGHLPHPPTPLCQLCVLQHVLAQDEESV